MYGQTRQAFGSDAFHQESGEKLIQVLLHGLEALVVPTLIILNEPCNAVIPNSSGHSYK